MMEENQRLTRLLADAEDKLREANFQRQQLMKKVNFLEELNNDLQQVAEHNKKLENQLRRISEIEALLARVSGQKPEGE
jgi:Tfp pilus assembly protein PilO